MGGAKRAKEDHDAEVDSVLERLIDAGAVERCEFHEYPVDQDDSEAVDAVRTELAEEVGQDEADKLIEEAMSQVCWECPGCESNRDE